MKISSVESVIRAFRAKYGRDALVPYADSDEDPYGTSFMIKDVPATFSVLTKDGTLPEGQYDFQIESHPAGDYLFTNIVSLEELLLLADLMAGLPEQWPTQTD
jgi:hypothetical protein